MKRALLAVLICGIASACSWDYRIWIPRSADADPLYRFVKDDKAGYIDSQGKVVTPPSLIFRSNRDQEFHDGRLKSAQGFVDRLGKPVAFPDVELSMDFSNGLAAAVKRGGKAWGFIDSNGRFAIEPKFDFVENFSEGLAAVQVGDKTGYIDPSGRFQIEPKFLDGKAFANGAALVAVSGPCTYFSDGPCPSIIFVEEKRPGTPSCKFLYIDKSGRRIGALEFDQARSFSEGLAPVRMEKIWGFIDRGGKLAIAPKFDAAWAFHSGLARIRLGALSGYADKSGAITIPVQYEYAEDFSEGFAVVRGPNGYHYIDRDGRDAGFGSFATASPFFKGLAHVRLSSGGGFAYIDSKGRKVFQY